jgi:Ca-activated chloride channel family protein
MLTHVAVDFGGFDVYDVEPVSVPDLLADRPLIVFGKWKGSASGTISLRGKTGAGDYHAEFPVSEARSMSDSNALTYLWARARIASLVDFGHSGTDEERAREVTTLGLTYNLLTAYTSFVAVDDVVRNPGGNAQSVKQPLPLPAGVENSAVGTPIHTTPEPGTWALLSVVAAVLGARLYRARKAKCARA